MTLNDLMLSHAKVELEENTVWGYHNGTIHANKYDINAGHW